ncbi:MAG: GrpE protein, partial [Rubrobacteraceae bacterium]|nr:GrpE protein [Rubrobacteraceae bacterium]
MSSEENKREPERREEGETPEEVEEAQGHPTDPASIQEPGVTEDAEEAPVEEEIVAQTGSSSEEPVALRAELEAARQERDEYLDALRRLKAEFENSRKRQERERS